MVNNTNLMVGLTGGMGCGKSTAAARFAERGFRRVDADQVIKEEILPSPDVADAIRAKLGADMLAADGSVRRDKVAEKVFKDPAALAWLEDLLHPRLLTRWREIIAAARGTAFVFEVPLLFEKGLENWFDFTICVTTDSALQLRRLEQRGVLPDKARERINQQLPVARKAELADFVLLNDGTPDFLREQVDVLADRLLKTQTDRPAGRIHVSPP